MSLTPPLPKEHGSWAMLAVPLILGLAVAPAWHWRALPLLVAALAFFLLRYPLALLVKTRRRAGGKTRLWTWAAVYAGIALISGGWLILAHGLWWLAPIGLLGGLLVLFHLWLVSRRQEMSLAGELSGIAGLALGAPMAYYTAAGQLDRTAAILWLINALYFGGTVFYIKLKVRQQPRLPAPGSSSRRLVKARACLTYQAAVLTVVVLLAALRWAPLLAPLAFVPVTVKVLRGAWHWQDRKSLSLTRLGVAELIHSVAFTVLVIIAFIN